MCVSSSKVFAILANLAALWVRLDSSELNTSKRANHVLTTSRLSAIPGDPPQATSPWHDAPLRHALRRIAPARREGEIPGTNGEISCEIPRRKAGPQRTHHTLLITLTSTLLRMAYCISRVPCGISSQNHKTQSTQTGQKGRPWAPSKRMVGSEESFT